MRRAGPIPTETWFREEGCHRATVDANIAGAWGQEVADVPGLWTHGQLTVVPVQDVPGRGMRRQLAMGNLRELGGKGNLLRDFLSR